MIRGHKELIEGKNDFNRAKGRHEMMEGQATRHKWAHFYQFCG